MSLRPPSCLLAVLLTACVSQTAKVAIYPDPVPVQIQQQEQAGLYDSWQIIESQNGPGEAGIPAWARLYLFKGFREVETLDAYSGKYVFVGENQGRTLSALQQWADGITVKQDLPRLIAQRVEQRFTASAVFYPDDEYGEYFANTIKKISDAEYPEAVKDQTFWIRRQRLPNAGEDSADNEDYDDSPQIDIYIEHYQFLLLISIDKEILQKMIQELLAGIKTNTPPTKLQAQAINKIRNNFFEGF